MPPPHDPVPYRVVYSGVVRQELIALVARAQAAGFGAAAFDAVKQVDYRLKIYPQFGDPLREIRGMRPVTIHAGTVPPLYVEYIIDDAERTVYIVVPIKTLPYAGFD